MRRTESSAPRTASTNACTSGTVRTGTGRRGSVRPPEPPRNKMPVKSAESTWTSHSHTPTRTLPNTPAPSTLMRNAGLAVLQNVSSRSASPLVTLPSR